MKSIPLKSFLLVFALILSMPQIQAQKKCKYNFDKEDPMTGERVMRNEVKLKSYFIVSYYRKADSLRIELNVRFVGERNFRVPKGSELKLKLSDGKILSFFSAQTANPLSYVGGSQILTNYAMTYYCSKEQMEDLAEYGFTVASTKLGDETITMEVKKKKVAKNANKARCMLVGL